MLAAESLQVTDVESIFSLTRTYDTDWVEFRTAFKLSHDSKHILNIMDTSVSNSDGKHEIALRLRLGILLTAVHSTSPDQCDSRLTPIPISPRCRFSFEPVIYKGEKRCLQGLPSFSLWYGPYAEKEYAAANFVVVETNKDQSSGGIPQAIAYMCKIHHAIFGLSTDNEQFHFLRIDSGGRWSRQDLNYSRRQEIVETLAYIHKQASILSTLEGNDGPKKSRSQRRTEDWSVFRVDENMCSTDVSEEDGNASD
ncbi:uncharacterized protein PGRI_080290 [Penicillium griseofulvum]|uniref:Uncharacterized protein n=1 Tax=Penicillium patulum TaxID=5078 RepID=A0A135LUX4_PENPA|nr:uncharacterized protein PGRI_080290 [Penicillium griseofulvum]KXG52773.1 hypothetical protein PGRI_080290 [Penicillium griseofulvum]